jgi:isoleucyl-tRNA synthetase
LRVIPAIRPEWENTAELERWRKIRGVLESVNGTLEQKRSEKMLGSSLEASVVVGLDAAVLKAFEGIESADVFRTSLADLTLSAAPVAVSLAEGHKCDRCWKVLTEVDPVEKLCGRCARVVANWGAK